MNNSDFTAVKITIDQSAEAELADRVNRMQRKGPPIELPPVTRAVQFLRGVSSRATMTLPSFYLYLGSNISPAGGDPAAAIKGYPGLVFQHATKFSAISMITLACRKTFDHDPKKMTGGFFAKISDQVLLGVAEYWANKSKRSLDDALAALGLLKAVFADCSKTDTSLFKASAVLGRRIGLLKQYADRSAAHLTLENYEFTPLDCSHVVAALTVIGEIIRSFDDHEHSTSYFDELDEASFSAAKQLFPALPDRRLFADMEIEQQSRLYWQFGIDNGRNMLLQQLPYATGWF
jgi:hypothetical protein